MVNFPKIIILLFLLLSVGCAYHVVKTTPHLRYGISSLALQRVENHSGVIGIEGPVRRNLETRLIDYMDAPYKDIHPCNLFGQSVLFHGMDQELKFVERRDEDEARVICAKKRHKTSLIVRILSVTLQPTSFVQGQATGGSLGLQKNALLAATYQVTATLELELYDPIIPDSSYSSKKSISKSAYTFTSSFAASTNQSDITGASKNTIRNQLFLVENMETISKAIADNIFSNLTSVF